MWGWASAPSTPAPFLDRLCIYVTIYRENLAQCGTCKCRENVDLIIKMYQISRRQGTVRVHISTTVEAMTLILGELNIWMPTNF